MYPNTVKKSTINETTISIVREHAKHPNSGHLCTDIIATEQPDLVCIESCPERFEFYRGSGHQSTVGALAAEQYCREHDNELFLLDILQSKASLELQLLPSKEEIKKELEIQLQKINNQETSPFEAADYLLGLKR